MATLEQIAEALRKADAAGHAEDARALAQAYRAAQQSAPQVSQEQLQRDMPMTGPRGAVKPSLWQQVQTTAPMPALMGAMDVAHEGANLLEQGLGAVTGSKAIKDDAQRNVAAMGEREREYQLARLLTGNDRPDVGRAIGQIGGTVAATPAMGTGGGIMAQSGRGAAQGALAGALSPVTDETKSYWGQKGEQVASSAAVGAAVPAVLGAASRVISPAASRNENVQELLGRNVRLTPGQMLGGASQRAEDKLRSLPITGDAITFAQRRSWDDFHRAVIDDVLQPIGAKLPSGVKNGHEAISYASDKIDDAYNQVIPRLQIDTPTVASTLQSAGTQAADANILPQQHAGRLTEILQSQLSKLEPNSPVVDGDTFKAIDSQLSSFMRGYTRSQDVDTRNLGQAIGEVRQALREAMAQQNPTHAPQLRAIDSAYARYVRAERAAAAAGAEGAFSPKQYDQSVRMLAGGARRGQAARGEALGQALSKAGSAVLPQSYPDSGTAGRLMAGSALGGATIASPNLLPMAGVLAGGAVPYLPGGRDIAEYAIARRPAGAAALAKQLSGSAISQRLPGASAALARLLAQP